jgi:hypothetical protein
MRCSLVLNKYLFIGTEEKTLYLIDTETFEISDQIQTQSFVFTIAATNDHTVICG